jgi:hypothetical protein
MEIIRPLMTRQRIEKREKKKHLFGKCVWKVSTGKVRKWENEKIRGTSRSFLLFLIFCEHQQVETIEKHSNLMRKERERVVFFLRFVSSSSSLSRIHLNRVSIQLGGLSNRRSRMSPHSMKRKFQRHISAVASETLKYKKKMANQTLDKRVLGEVLFFSPPKKIFSHHD